MFDAVKPVSIGEIESARERLEELGLIAPLVFCNAAPAKKRRSSSLRTCNPSAHSRSDRSAMRS
jgi:hypothetical protein